ncbi:MAG: AarF/ABC1/UbiB kinase family protein [Nanoarchaeota archaeon]|nr:AarF/ABC1/UbiB kinase family protein [Nanoarchaeota archaeon]
MGVRRRLQDLHRFKTIATVLSKQGFGMLVDKTTSGSHGLHAKPQIRLRKAFEELGGAFVKLGQLLALRPDLLPAKYCEEFEKLQEHAKPISFQEVKKVLQEEFSRPLATMFSKIESKPLAVGSVAQVHQATLTNGKQVVIKVLKPKVIEEFEEDIDLISFFAARIKKFVPSDVIDPERIVDEFKKYTKRELDFSFELASCQEFSKLDIIMQTPRPFKELSTKKVLVLEFLEGIPLSKKSYGSWPKDIRREVAKHIALSMMKQVFVHGIFHADPHPGNILVKKNYRLALIDFGIVGTVDTKTKVTLTIILHALLNKDVKLLSRSLLRLGISKEQVNKDELEFDLKETLGPYYDAKLSEIKISSLFSQSISVARKHHLQVPEKFVLLGKAIATTESVCHLVDPQFQFVSVARPFLKSHLPRLISSKFVLSQAKEEILDYGELIINMPKDIQRLIKIKEDDHKSLSQLQGSIVHLEKEFLFLQKEFMAGLFGVILIIISLLINQGDPVFLGLSLPSTTLFFLGIVFVLSLIRLRRN